MMTEEEIRRFLSNLDREAAPPVTKVQFPAFDASSATALPVKTGLSFLEDIKVDLVAELGETTMRVRDVLELKEGSVIELDRVAGEAIDLLLNNQKFARGEVLVLNEIFAVRVSAIHSPRRLRNGEKRNG
uniref:Flagellar motor switch protein FliN n=1 Tax=Ammonifex degensii TaxID=42838 RepID=A0A7C2EIR3_9THEO